jgi:hypothetical protein
VLFGLWVCSIIWVTHIFSRVLSAASESFARPFALPRKGGYYSHFRTELLYVQVSSRLTPSRNGFGQFARAFFTSAAFRVNYGLANMRSPPSPAACVMEDKVRNTTNHIVTVVLIYKKLISLSFHPFAMKLVCIMQLFSAGRKLTGLLCFYFNIQFIRQHPMSGNTCICRLPSDVCIFLLC